MRISCTGAKCAVTEVEYMASGAINYFTASFTFDNAWSDFISANKLYGIFEGSDSVILTTLVYNSETQTYDCDVPWETIKYQGKLLVGVIGHLTTPETKILTTNMAFGYKIPEGAATNASTGSQPSGLLLDILEAAEQVSADADRAEVDADRAETAKAGAESARDTAITAKNDAVTAKTAAQTAQTAAESAKTAAKTSEVNAKTSETNAATSATNAASSASSASGSEANALASKNAAATSASNAATSETKAKTSETNAKTAETGALAAKTAAESAKSIAVTAKDNAVLAKTDAETAQGLAETAKLGADAAKSGADTAKAGAESARDTAITAKNDAVTAKNAAQTAQTAAETAKGQAETARSGAQTAATTAGNKALDSEAFGAGTRNGVAVTSGDSAYQNNAKWYKDQASEIVGGDFPTKTEAQGYATTAETNANAYTDTQIAAIPQGLNIVTSATEPNLNTGDQWHKEI